MITKRPTIKTKTFTGEYSGTSGKEIMEERPMTEFEYTQHLEKQLELSKQMNQSNIIMRDDAFEHLKEIEEHYKNVMQLYDDMLAKSGNISAILEEKLERVKKVADKRLDVICALKDKYIDAIRDVIKTHEPLPEETRTMSLHQYCSRCETTGTVEHVIEVLERRIENDIYY